MPLYIMSDAHFGSGTPEKEAEKLEKFRRFTELAAADGDRLVILGDLFDFWFEYKHAIPKNYTDIIILIAQLKQRGLAIDYVSGNHDFWMGDFFTEELGISVHRDELNVEYAGKRLHLLHGDGLAKSDRGYRLLKKILRNPFNVWLYRKLPADWAIPLAKWVSGSSREYTSKRDHTFTPEYEAYARSRLSDGFDFVAIGHLHIPSFKQFDNGIYINTGDFINHFSYARIDQDDISLKYMD